MKIRRILCLGAALLIFATPSLAATAVLAGGCFWCMESDFEKLPGVSDVVSGFSGGTLPNPTYYGDHTGHYEVVEITYDPQLVSYRQLLDYYWRHIDPFDDGGQFCDRGHSYKAAIFVVNDEERKIAEASKAEVQALFPEQQVATQILPATAFWPIKGEEGNHHQDYYKKNPVRYKFYRWNCGRDQRVQAIWGDQAPHE